MKIYTKTGDQGTTSLLGGTRVPKHHLRIEAYGTLDELNSWVGTIRSAMLYQESIPVLNQIQNDLFNIGSHLATDPSKNKVKLPDFNSNSISILENEIDKMDADLPALTNFILPGGSSLVGQIHITRCVCRRAERLITHLAELENVDPIFIQYINRLSDYFFTLGRREALAQGAEEILWQA